MSDHLDQKERDANLSWAEKNLTAYRSHKVVRAAKIVGVNIETGVITMLGGQHFQASQPFLAKHRPAENDWLIVYADGFASISPNAAFVNGYTRVED